jgi:diketogulonate reductase-like aldo/keto reductase
MEALRDPESEHDIKRDELWITTKVNKNVKDFRKTLVFQLELMGLTYVDAYLIYTPKATPTERITNVDLWNQMIVLKNDGSVQTIGVSNFRAYHLRELEQCE